MTPEEREKLRASYRETVLRYISEPECVAYKEGAGGLALLNALQKANTQIASLERKLRITNILLENKPVDTSDIPDLVEMRLAKAEALLTLIASGLCVRWPAKDGTRDWCSECSTYLRGDAGALLEISEEKMRELMTYASVTEETHEETQEG